MTDIESVDFVLTTVVWSTKYNGLDDNPAIMNIPPKFAAVGRETSTIDVRLSYKIVDLFSEGLYSSPNKAVEELVANSFDAGATRVAVFVPADFHTQDATIAVLDNGEGMASALRLAAFRAISLHT